MRNSIFKTFFLALTIIIMLLALHFAPVPVVGDTKLRSVDILSDVVPDKEAATAEVVPVVKSKPKLPYKEVCPKGVTPILDYGFGTSGGMAKFYDALENAKKSGRPVRIAYFSDSFIEGDIFTGELRHLLQERYGGYGVGWIDCSAVASGLRKTAVQKASGFSSHDIICKKNIGDKSRIGFGGHYFVPSENATLSITGTKYNKFVERWSVSSIFFRTSSPLRLTATINGKDKTSYNVSGSADLQHISVSHPNTTRIVWRVNGNGGSLSAASFYGACQDGKSGVTVDNYSLRGFSGVDLKLIPSKMLREFQQQRHYDLIVIHYGLNTLNKNNPPYFYAGYRKRMTNTIKSLRQSLPGVPFLVVSISDRDDRSNSTISTMVGVKSLVAYQQMMAADCKTGYWSLFDAMGGESSMRPLVECTPPMANHDYTHLNFRGGRKLAKLLYDAINNGVDNNMKRKEYYKK